jgi:hypothetical protein
MMELLAQSLAPSALPQLPALAQQPRQGAGAPPAPALHPLCVYVLSTFVRRYLSRAHIKHVSNERAAVNALRLVEVSCMSRCMRLVMTSAGGSTGGRA